LTASGVCASACLIAGLVDSDRRIARVGRKGVARQLRFVPVSERDIAAGDNNLPNLAPKSLVPVGVEYIHMPLGGLNWSSASRVVFGGSRPICALREAPSADTQFGYCIVIRYSWVRNKLRPGGLALWR
jgi:hypothetical protein